MKEQVKEQEWVELSGQIWQLNQNCIDMKYEWSDVAKFRFNKQDFHRAVMEILSPYPGSQIVHVCKPVRKPKE